MEEIIDTIASEYGWTKDYILDCTYLEEIMVYVKLIAKRKLERDMMHLQIMHGNAPQLMDTMGEHAKQLLPDGAIMGNNNKEPMNALKNILGSPTGK